MNVSILICTYGEERWQKLALERAHPSAQQQSDAHEIRAWHSPGEGTSLAEVRNRAAREATGDVLCFLDADDELAPGYVTAMRDTAAQRVSGGDTPFASPALEEIGTGKIAEPARRPTTEALYYPAVQYVYGRREDEPVILGGGRPLVELNRAVIGTLVPRALFLDLGGFRDLPALEDWELWLRCSLHVPLVAVPAAVYRVHVRRGGRNSDQSLYRQIRAEHEAEVNRP